jgi:hypothetical protein
MEMHLVLDLLEWSDSHYTDDRMVIGQPGDEWSSVFINTVISYCNHLIATQSLRSFVTILL